ncbi:sensor domain-containing protein [Streptomyces sp. AJS327]|uniref:hypothetical protein n=1 Tax=Streptomyces sp. AJS327 TaxID=2545265 RepID=UPI0015DF22AB|nr:hypothetical protein [Streptomyces sp. AJS327]MBA0049399.1 sensor domain-containing protein [Streptomyces sp. AJS327]
MSTSLVTSARRRRVRRLRGAAAATAVPVLLFSLAACGSGDDEGDDDGGSGGSSQGQSGGDGGASGGGGEAGETPTLTEKQLDAALLKNGDVPGYKVQKSKADLFPEKERLTPDKPECQPVADVFGAKSTQERQAYTGGSLMRGDFSTGGTMSQVLLASYKEGDAQKWFADLRKAFRECDGFTAAMDGEKPEGGKLKPYDGKIGLGDEALRFSWLDPKDSEAGKMVVTLVRTGANVATYLSVNLEGKEVPVKKAIAEKQDEKLRAAGGN